MPVLMDEFVPMQIAEARPKYRHLERLFILMRSRFQPRRSDSSPPLARAYCLAGDGFKRVLVRNTLNNC
jgi:hypothetical protein